MTCAILATVFFLLNLFYRSEILINLNAKQRFVNKSDYIVNVLFMDHFNCGMHVA